MPTFNVIVPEGRLSSEPKTRVAVAIGRTYKELTGVPENLTQVIFIEVKRLRSSSSVTWCQSPAVGCLPAMIEFGCHHPPVGHAPKFREIVFASRRSDHVVPETKQTRRDLRPKIGQP